jgi:hypothetical protein
MRSVGCTSSVICGHIIPTSFLGGLIFKLTKFLSFPTKLIGGVSVTDHRHTCSTLSVEVKSEVGRVIIVNELDFVRNFAGITPH